MTAPKRKLPEPFDGVTLEQLRMFAAVSGAGSFSAAGRQTGRVQSAVSQAMASLEAAVGFKLWDRSERTVKLTDRGLRLLGDARRVLNEVDRMRDAVHALRGGKVDKLALCVDALFPPRALVSLIRSMQDTFPAVELRIDSDTLGGVAERVERRDADVGIAGPLAASKALERVAIGSILLLPACAPTHPLASEKGRIATDVLRRHRQIVLSERRGGASPDQAVLSDRTWRVVDLPTKRELIASGLGWGNLPAPLGELTRLSIEAWSEEEHRIPLVLIFSPALRARPVVRWLVSNLPPLCSSWGVGLPISAGDG